MLLKDKTVVVTGGASGIGRAIALAAARHGAKAVVIGDVIEQPREGGRSTRECVEAQGAESVFLPTDVSDRAQVAALVDAADRFGGVDLMACNAGIALQSDGPEITDGDFARLLAVNLQGALISAQEAARSMKARGRGAIVVTSAMGGIRGAAHTTGYSTTKGGINLLVASLADGLGQFGIRINAVCPGIIETALIGSSDAVAAAIDGMRARTPLRRTAKAEEVGEAVVWLGSDSASFVTGVALPVDGGITAVL